MNWPKITQSIAWGILLVASIALAPACIDGNHDVYSFPDAEPIETLSWSIDPSFSEEEKLAVGEALARWNPLMVRTVFVLDSDGSSRFARFNAVEKGAGSGVVRDDANPGITIELSLNQTPPASVYTLALHELGHVAAWRADHVPDEQGPALMTHVISASDVTSVDLEYCGERCAR